MLFAMGTGVLMAISLLIVMARLGLRKFMGYPAVLDFVVVVVLGWLLHGTFGGMTAAITGGLFFSLMITLIRKYYGWSKLTANGWKVESYGLLGKPSKDWMERLEKIPTMIAMSPIVLGIMIFIMIV